MTHFTPRHDAWDTRLRDSFARQAMMATMGVTIEALAPGQVTLSMPFDARFTQQHGFLHAGAVTSVLDTAAGYAAFSLMAADAAVLTAEFKTSLLAPAKGQNFRFVGEVLKSGRTLTFTEARAYALDGDTERLIATMSATMMAVTGRGDVAG